MRYYFLLLLVFFSCSTKQAEKVLKAEKQIVIDTVKIDTVVAVKSKKEAISWEEKQAFLRDSILSSKPYKLLKSDFFQEFYIRGLVSQEKNNIKFDLPFNLHSLDCGTPDCYTTHLSFKIPAKKATDFPTKILVQFRETGCYIEKEIHKTIEFTLVEKKANYVNYYSSAEKSNLILIGNKQESKLYYFIEVAPNVIQVNLIHQILQEYDEENPDAIVPYKSWQMETIEYENF